MKIWHTKKEINYILIVYIFGYYRTLLVQVRAT
jgi:hypothetical protein